MSDTLPVTDPLRRYGVVLWAAWLVFLVFPVLGTLAVDDLGLRVLGLVATGAFAVLYVVGFLGFTAAARPLLPSTAVLGGLLVLALVMVPVLGLDTVSFAPFLQALGVFTLPRPLNWWWSGVVAVVAVLTPWLLDPSPGWFFLSFIVVAVGLGTAAGRLMADQGAEHTRVQEELNLTAERDRVARDVHDVLGHSLTVVAIKAELAERLVELDPERARAELRDVQQLARQALAEVRATVGGLRMARLDVELTGATRALAAAGIEAEVVGAADDLDPRHRPVAAWALREAVTNVVRHSGASSCRVEVLASGLRVLDDGSGVVETRGDGNGLRGLRERVAASGGRLEVAAAPTGGTCLEVAW